MSTDREILESLVVDDPWSNSWEGLDDCCIFCGSGLMEYGTVEGVKYWHEATCPWMKAVTYLGRSHGIHGYIADRPRKPPVPPCETCLNNSNSTVHSHVAHLMTEMARSMLARQNRTEDGTVSS